MRREHASGASPRRRPRKRVRTQAQTTQRAPVAQLDRVSDSDSEGRRFDSCRVYQTSLGILPRLVSLHCNARRRRLHTLFCLRSVSANASRLLPPSLVNGCTSQPFAQIAKGFAFPRHSSHRLLTRLTLRVPISIPTHTTSCRRLYVFSANISAKACTTSTKRIRTANP